MKIKKVVLNDYEAETDESGAPVVRRFAIQEPLSTEVLAIIEAYTRDEAHKRFERLRPFFRSGLKAVVDDFFGVVAATDDPATSALPLFNNTFFEVLDCTDRLLH